MEVDNERKKMKYLGITILALSLGACTSRGIIVDHEVTILSGPAAPGTVIAIWEEPMVDVVEVPPGLDPEGIYYRPAHQAVVEIRQGRWRYDQSK